MLGLKLNHVSKRGHMSWNKWNEVNKECIPVTEINMEVSKPYDYGYDYVLGVRNGQWHHRLMGRYHERAAP